jgi:hydrogenase expression/formation protein HypE
MTTRAKTFFRKLDLAHGVVEATHGTGGKVMAQLVEELFLPAFDSKELRARNDGALLEVGAGQLVVSTDSYVVSPLFFPGGDIGSLAVHGTVNDVAMGGARPLALTVGFILEEGFPLKDLARIVASMAAAAKAAGVPIVTGDTKVVERGKGDGVFINTTGVGMLPAGRIAPSAERMRPGDVVLVSGTMGDHGVSILSTRESLSFESELKSDSAALNSLVELMYRAVPDLHVLRDPTRGGLATTLNELTHHVGVGVRLREKDVPVKPQVHAACELLGLDPLYAANEGKLLVVCAPGDAKTLLNAMKEHPLGRDAAIVGEVVEDPECFVQIDTTFGGARILDWLAGEQLPRIC